jgi:hypothetical protein
VLTAGPPATLALASDADAVVEALRHSQSVVRKVVNLASVAMNYMYAPRSHENENTRAIGGNYGNVIWQFGATRMINPFTTLLFDPLVKGRGCRADALILAQANMLIGTGHEGCCPGVREGPLSGLTRLVEEYDVGTIVLGIGIQADFNDYDSANISEIESPAYQVAFLQAIASLESSPGISVRGSYTEMLCKNAGVDKCLPLGCPSLAISRDVDLGATLQRRWDAMAAKISRGERLKKLVITTPGGFFSNPTMFSRVLNMLARLYQDHDTHIILQEESDAKFLHTDPAASEILKGGRIVHFQHAEQWREYLSDADLVISSKIHGCMAGISVGTPSIVIPWDIRILELAEAMVIPTLRLQKIAVGLDRLEQILPLVERDFDRFETSRRQKLGEYARMLNGIGLEMDPTLLPLVPTP